MKELANFKVVTGEGLNIDLEQVLYEMKLQNGLLPVRDAIEDLLVSNIARRQGVTVSDEELQAWADQARINGGLALASDMQEWLKQRDMSLDDFENYAEIECMRQKLKEAVAADKVKDYFEKNHVAFDSAIVRRIAFDNEAKAEEAKAELESDMSQFSEMAITRSLDEGTRDFGGYLGRVLRDTMLPAVAAKVFESESGGLIGPLRVGSVWYLIHADHIHPAQLDKNTEEAIRELIFEDWLDEYIVSNGLDLSKVREFAQIEH